jgi:predicted ATPase
MERAVPLTRLQLSPLTSEDILRLLQALGGENERRAADLERFGQWLFAETEGQPFYLMETLKVLLDRGVLASRPNEEGDWTLDFTAAMEHETVVHGFFPPGVREVICARLDRLTPHAFALLLAGAVLGRGITFGHLCQVADFEEEVGLAALDEVLHSGLLYESERGGEGRGRMTGGHYVFAHAMICAVVYAEAGEARRSIFHHRAVQTLQEAAAPGGGTHDAHGVTCPYRCDSDTVVSSACNFQIVREPGPGWRLEERTRLRVGDSSSTQQHRNVVALHRLHPLL